jgi:signal transduction histidine kinase
VASGVITGCVYVVELDQEQAALLSSIQSNAVRMMVLTVLVSIFAYLLFGVLVTTKNQRLLQSFRLVRQGDYAHRVQVQGHDEYALLASEFNALTDRLQDIEEKRRQFVSDASHELRTPLAAMRLLSDSILQNEMDMDTVREFVQDISSEADRLTRMTSKLLNLTALDSRQFETAEPEIVDLGACCKKAVRMLSPFAQELGAQIEQSSEENCCVSAREDDIFQLVLNLAENGLKYSQKGGQVRLIAYTQGETAVLIVEDNGVGIPEEELERIFERFYRVDKARSREAGGTGLGLAIVRETAEKFGGSVTAANRPQGGARFTVKFPRCKWEGEP